MTTKTEKMTNNLARAVWSDAVVWVTRSDDGATEVVIHGTQPPLRACMEQLRVTAITEAGAWRRALARLRGIAGRIAIAEAKRADAATAQALRFAANSERITKAIAEASR